MYQTTVVEMVRARGYSNIQVLQDSKSAFAVAIDSHGLYTICVYMHNENRSLKPLLSDINWHIETMSNKKNVVKHVIIVLFMRTKIPLDSFPHIQIEIFCLDDVEFNVSKAVPLHRKLDQTQVTALLAGFDIHKLPCLLQSDAQSRFMGFEVGDIIHVDSYPVMYYIVT